MTEHGTINPERHKQLFLDDHAVESAAGVTRTLHQPEKQGARAARRRLRRADGRAEPQRAAVELGQGRSGSGGTGPSTTRRTRPATGSTTTRCRRTGSSGRRPPLGLYEGRTSADHNVSWDPAARTVYHVIRDERDPDPRRRYKGLFDVFDRWIGFSPDGFDWTLPDISPRAEPGRVALRLRRVDRTVPGDREAGDRVGPLRLPVHQRGLRRLELPQAGLQHRRAGQREPQAAHQGGHRRPRLPDPADHRGAARGLHRAVLPDGGDAVRGAVRRLPGAVQPRRAPTARGTTPASTRSS